MVGGITWLEAALVNSTWLPMALFDQKYKPEDSLLGL